QCVRDGQNLCACDCADGARRLADLVAEMGRPPYRALEQRQPLAFRRPKKEEAAGSRRLQPNSRTDVAYLSCVEMLSNFAFRLVPIALTVAIITTEMPAAMRPYSIAVAPDSSFRNATTLDIWTSSMWLKL